MVYRICVTKYGYTNVEADDEYELDSIIKNKLRDSDFDWSDFDEPEIVEEFTF